MILDTEFEFENVDRSYNCAACEERVSVHTEHQRVYKLWHKGQEKKFCRECYRELRYGEIPRPSWRK